MTPHSNAVDWKINKSENLSGSARYESVATNSEVDIHTGRYAAGNRWLQDQWLDSLAGQRLVDSIFEFRCRAKTV